MHTQSFLPALLFREVPLLTLEELAREAGRPGFLEQLFT